MEENKITSNQESHKSPSGKKAYHQPVLRSYGNLRDLTKGGSGFNPEGSSGMVGMGGGGNNKRRR